MIAPGALFSIKDTYHNYMRLSAGTWEPGMEKAIAHLGKLCAMAPAKDSPKDSMDCT
jgi:hypothetical protein